jgi:hypothetical protein
MGKIYEIADDALFRWRASLLACYPGFDAGRNAFSEII